MDKIARPGMYDLTAERYHDDCCVAPSVSKTGLATLIFHSPAKFYATAPFNPNAVPREEKKAWSVGQAVHELILLGKDEFYARNKALPEGIDLRMTEGKELKAKAEAAGVRLLSHKNGQMVEAMHRAFATHPLAPMAFIRGLPERSLIWRDEETGVWLKVRPDFLPDRIGIIAEYKSTVLATKAAFRRDARRYGYHLQAALYLWGIREVLGETPDDFVFVCQEKEPPYVVRLFSLEDDWYTEAHDLLRAAIRLFAQCLERDEWPDYGGDVERVSLFGQPDELTVQAERAFEEAA